MNKNWIRIKQKKENQGVVIVATFSPSTALLPWSSAPSELQVQAVDVLLACRSLICGPTPKTTINPSRTLLLDPQQEYSSPWILAAGRPLERRPVVFGASWDRWRNVGTNESPLALRPRPHSQVSGFPWTTWKPKALALSVASLLENSLTFIKPGPPTPTPSCQSISKKKR